MKLTPLYQITLKTKIILVVRYAKGIHRKTTKLPAYLFSVFNCQTTLRVERKDRAPLLSATKSPYLIFIIIKPTNKNQLTSTNIRLLTRQSLDFYAQHPSHATPQIHKKLNSFLEFGKLCLILKLILIWRRNTTLFWDLSFWGTPFDKPNYPLLLKRM